MRILLLSDIHANAEALEAVLRDAGCVDALWCAGDLVDYGTDPHQVVSLCRERGIACVSGNHDRHLLSVRASDEVTAFRGTRNWKWVHDNCERITPQDAAYLQDLPLHLSLTADGIAYLIQHQMREGPLAYAMPESVQDFDACWAQWYDGPPSAGMERRMIFGHTHRRCLHQLAEDRLWLNPGSVSYRRPDDADKSAHYMIIDCGRVEFHAVSYDRTSCLKRAMAYVESGAMMETELQDALFFFGDAHTTRDPLPRALGEKGSTLK